MDFERQLTFFDILIRESKCPEKLGYIHSSYSMLRF